MRGGADSIHFGKRSLTPPNFILEQQTESHMKAEVYAEIWYPIEVAEVEIAASGGRRSGQGPDEKKSFKNLEIGNFWGTKTLYTSKESLEQSSFRFETKSETFVLKKLKKSRFRDFRSQKIKMSCQSRLNFWKTCQDSKKMTLPTNTWDVYG